MVKQAFVEEVVTLPGGVRMRAVIHRGDEKLTPIVFINGIGMNLEPWEPLLDELQKVRDCTTIRFDIPTGNRWLKPGGWLNNEMAHIATLIDAMLHKLRFTEVDVVGVSWGGILAQELARLCSDEGKGHTRMRRLILSATTCGYNGKSGSLRALLGMPRLRIARNDRAKQRLGLKVYAGDLLDNPELVNLMPGDNKPSDRDWWYRFWAIMMPQWSSKGWLHELTMPTLVISGDDDPLVPRENADILVRLIPKAILKVIERGGHMHLFTRPKDMAELIAWFFAAAAPF